MSVETDPNLSALPDPGQGVTSLLPNGLSDLMPGEAEREAAAIEKLISTFSRFGYERVKPPLVEFEETLLSGPGTGLARQTFRLMDPVSRRMMGVRSDMTPQIGRLALGRFTKDDYPLRLTYAGDVLRVNGSQLRPERQFCQAGCELVGIDSTAADIEAIMLALIGLNTLDLEGASIDLNLPGLSHLILGAEAPPAIMTAVKRKDSAEAGKLTERAFSNETAVILTTIMESSGLASNVLPKLKQLKTGDDALHQTIKRYVDVAEGMTAALADLKLDCTVTLDPLEASKRTYHTGIGFSLYSRASRRELGRGGRYHIDSGDQEHPVSAIGFTLFLDGIRPLLPASSKPDVKAVSAETSWADIQAQQKQGVVTIRDL